jgi:hypothetical protein
MLEDPEEAIERLWREYEKKLGRKTDADLR